VREAMIMTAVHASVASAAGLQAGARD